MALDLVIRCGEIQKEMFFKNFMVSQRPGEITCVNEDDDGDTLIFEHYRVNGVDFVAAFRLLCEDSVISCGFEPHYLSHELLLAEKTERQRELYEAFLKKIESEGKTVAQVKKEMERDGKDASLIDFREYTRDMLEDRLPPGKKTIQGSRYGKQTIEVLERQKEIPSDLQRARLNQYFLETPANISYLEGLKPDDEQAIADWKSRYLMANNRIFGLTTKMPFYRDVIRVMPKIYAFPDKEAMIEKN